MNLTIPIGVKHIEKTWRFCVFMYLGHMIRKGCPFLIDLFSLQYAQLCIWINKVFNVFIAFKKHQNGIIKNNSKHYQYIPKSSRKYKSVSVRNDQEWRCNSCIGRKSNICLLILVLCQTFEEEFGGAYHQVFQNTKLWHPEVGRPFIHGNENWAPLHTWLQ